MTNRQKYLQEKYRGAIEEIKQKQRELNSLLAELEIDIEWEYSTVSFAKARNDGIDKFWELSGLRH